MSYDWTDSGLPNNKQDELRLLLYIYFTGWPKKQILAFLSLN